MELNFLHLFLLAFLYNSVKGLTRIQEEKIEAYIEDVYMKFNKVPGLIISIVENGEVVHAKGYGYQNIKEKTSADEKTLMAIGSLSKGILGTLVVKVLNEKFPDEPDGALDTPLQILLPNSNITFMDRYRTQSMTFRDLLSHRSCLFSDDFDLVMGSKIPIPEKLYRIRYAQEICTFRNGYFYNNGLYGLAGELIAEVAGKPFTELLTDFSKEIGMAELSVIDKDGLFEKLEHMSSAYYIKDGETYVFNPKLIARVNIVTAAGGVLASAADMAAYMKFHLNKGKVGDVQIIPQEVLERVFVNSNPTNTAVLDRFSDSDPVLATIGYSLGYISEIYDGWESHAHGGYWPPFESAIRMLPALNTGIFVCTNGPGMSAGTGSGISNNDLLQFIFSVLRGKETNGSSHPAFVPATRPAAKLRPNVELPKTQKRAQKNYEELIGLYGQPTHGNMYITFEDKKNQTLQMSYGNFGIGRLVPKQDLLFEIEWKTDIVQQYYTFGTTMTIPAFGLDLSNENVAVIQMDGIPAVVFVKDAVLETFPAIPWLPDSCAPES